jgi:dTDP-4-dehydrorhamnose 3,5-epimerase-like enzyme
MIHPAVPVIGEPRLITLPSFPDQRGTLSVFEWAGMSPFEPKRFYYIYNSTSGARRGLHAHFVEEELIVALAGHFTVWLDDGSKRTEHRLDRPDRALYVPALIWHELADFSANAVCAVFASTECNNNEDYCRDYQEFLKARSEKFPLGGSPARPVR